MMPFIDFILPFHDNYITKQYIGMDYNVLSGMMNESTHPFIHSTHILIFYYVPDIFLGTKDIEIEKTHKIPLSHKVSVPMNS